MFSVKVSRSHLTFYSFYDLNGALTGLQSLSLRSNRIDDTVAETLKAALGGREERREERKEERKEERGKERGKKRRGKKRRGKTPSTPLLYLPVCVQLK